eukprot:488424_1
MGQIAIRTERKDDDQSNHVASYSFSYDFNYLDRCKHSKQVRSTGYVKDLYVQPKHDSLKDELLNNVISCIHLQTWMAACQQAEAQKKSHRYRRITATFAADREGSHEWEDTNPIHSGYRSNHKNYSKKK